VEVTAMCPTRPLLARQAFRVPQVAVVTLLGRVGHPVSPAQVASAVPVARLARAAPLALLARPALGAQAESAELLVPVVPRQVALAALQAPVELHLMGLVFVVTAGGPRAVPRSVT
jgi:hypothetical protein